MSACTTSTGVDLIDQIDCLTAELVEVFTGENSQLKSLPEQKLSSPFSKNILGERQANETIGAESDEAVFQAKLELSQANRRLESNLEKKVEKLTDLEATKKALESESEQLRQENRLLRSQLDDLTSQCNEHKVAAKMAVFDAERLKEQLLDLQNLCVLQQEALNHNHEVLDEKFVVERQMKTTIDDLTRLKGQHLKCILRFLARNVGMKKKIADLSKDVSERNVALSQLRQSERLLKSQLDHKSRILSEFKSSYQRLQTDSDKLRKENQRLQTNLDELRNENQRLQTNLDELRNENRRLSKNLNELETHGNLQEAFARERRVTFETVQRVLESAYHIENEIQELRLQCETQRVNLNQREKELDEKAKLESQLKITIVELRNKLKRQADDF